MAETQTVERPERLMVADSELAPRSGLRVRPQRPVRALFGALVVVASVLAALAIFTRVGDRREVLALSRTVLAGEQLADADLKVVSIASDESFLAVPASDRGLLVGQYAKVRMLQGSLMAADSVQPEPLVDPARVLMSVPVQLSGVPSGLREGSRLVLIVTPFSTGAGSPVPVLVEAMVAAVPANLGQLVGGDGSSSVTSAVALSVEVPAESVAVVGSAESVAVGVLDPKAPFPAQPAANGAPDAAAGSTPVPTTAPGEADG
jgi:hypothetical protein